MTALPEVAQQARRLPARGLLVFRWLSLAWLVVLAATGSAGGYRPALTWTVLAVLAGWTAWVTAHPVGEPAGLGIDLALAAGLILAAGLVAKPGALDSGPSLATYYPAVAVIAWGLARGPVAGAMSALALVVALVAGRLLNDSSVVLFQGRHVAALVNAAIGYLLVGVVVGGFARLVDAMAKSLEAAMGEALREQSQVSRLRERESLARQIHDSVLQALALINKRGRELASTGAPSAPEVAELAELARQQEQSLRRLVLQPPLARSPGPASLRDALQPVVDGVSSVPVTLSVAGPIELRLRDAEELAAAVKEALANVVKHAAATRATVFAEQEDGVVVVSVRDDGNGFTLDEAALAAADKAGILRSIKGRAADLGGTMTIRTAPGRGTEVELRVPYRRGEGSAGG